MQWKNKARIQCCYHRAENAGGGGVLPLPIYTCSFTTITTHPPVHPREGEGRLPLASLTGSLCRKCVKFYKMMNVTQSCQPIQTTPDRAALGTKTPHWEIEFPHFSENVTHLHLHSPSESLTQSEVRWWWCDSLGGAREYWDTLHILTLRSGGWWPLHGTLACQQLQNPKHLWVDCLLQMVSPQQQPTFVVVVVSRCCWRRLPQHGAVANHRSPQWYPRISTPSLILLMVSTRCSYIHRRPSCSEIGFW